MTAVCLNQVKQNTNVNKQTKVMMFLEGWGRGGIESFVMDVVRCLQHSGYDFEIFSPYDWDNSYDAELRDLGINRLAVFSGCMPSLIRRFVAGLIAWGNRLRKGDVDIVHINAQNATSLAYATVAKRFGVPVRIVHSHNNSFNGGFRAIKRFIHNTCRALWFRSATCRIACSRDAGRYMFGKERFHYVPNGIDVEKFKFDKKARARVRNELDVTPETLLIGSIGRISFQKNPLFSVGVLKELLDRGKDVKLLLIGGGELEGAVENRVCELGIEDYYIHVPIVANPEDYYSAMDVFLMPSIFEGFGYALVEAQCNGLVSVVSSAIQDEACVTDIVARVPLEDGAISWGDAVAKQANRTVLRESYSDRIYDAGLSSDVTIERVGELYQTECARKEKI